MKKLRFCLIGTVVSFLPVILLSQTSEQDSIWSPFNYFIGKWEGPGTAGGANGKYERSYQYIFNKRFIEIRNKSTYPPTKENPNGEVHEDLGYISYDRARKTFVLRQFHIEGFVNQYKLDTISPDKKTIVFRTENIENIAPGWSARENYQLLSNNEFIEKFELAEPNGAFEEYSSVKLVRQ